MLPLMVADRHDRGGVHSDDRSHYLLPQGPGLPGREEGGEVVGDDDRRAARQGHQGGLGVVPVALEVERVLDPAHLELRVEVSRGLQQEGVQPVAGPGVVVPEPVVHQQRKAQLVRLLHGEVERRVVPRPERALHPIEDVVAAGARSRLAAGVNPQVVGHAGASAARAMLRSIPAKTNWWIPHSAYQ